MAMFMFNFPHCCYDLPNKPLSEITADDYPPHMRDAIKEVEEMGRHPHTYEEFIAQSRGNCKPLDDEIKSGLAEPVNEEQAKEIEELRVKLAEAAKIYY